MIIHESLPSGYYIGNVGICNKTAYIDCMEGCPLRCPHCASRFVKEIKNLTAEDILWQVAETISVINTVAFYGHGEPWLNLDEVRRAIDAILTLYPHLCILLSTVGIKGSDFSWIKDSRIDLEFNISHRPKGCMSLADISQVMFHKPIYIRTQQIDDEIMWLFDNDRFIIKEFKILV